MGFRRAADGSRSTSAFGRAVVAAALRAVDQRAADAAARETDWRRGYLPHFRALVEAGLGSGDAAYDIARAGLAAVHDRMRYGDARLSEAFTAPVKAPLRTQTFGGTGTAERQLVLPYRKVLLRGADLDRQLDAWVSAGTIEGSCAHAVREVAANPDWLDLSDLRLVVLGAGSEMGPLRPVLRWGGTVVGVDLPHPDLWARIGTDHPGRLIVPVSPDGTGIDLLRGLPVLADWLLGIDGRLVAGMYMYADGATHVRLSAAVDALGARLRQYRPDTAIAFLATPTDVFGVPGAAVAQSLSRYASTRAGQLLGTLSGGRLLQPNYPAPADPGVNDSLVPQQGPNYALAKRIQRWRATVARRTGATVSLTVAPPTRTRSVLKNRALAAAYHGGYRFGVETFEPETSHTLMAALLVHQLRRPRPAGFPAWEDEAYAAAHGGLWRIAYQPRSALGLAAVLGVRGALRR